MKDFTLDVKALENLPEQSNEVFASSSVKQLLRIKGVSGEDGENGLVGDELDSIIIKKQQQMKKTTGF